MNTAVKTAPSGKARLIRAINTGRHIMGMDKETWQRYLKGKIHKASSPEQADSMPDVELASLGTLQLNRLLDAMRADGYGRKQGASGKPGAEPDPHAIKQRGLIRALWAGMARLSIVRSSSKESLDAFCMRQCKRHLDFMTSAQCQKLIEALKGMWRDKTDLRGKLWLQAILDGRMSVEDLPDGSMLVGGLQVGGSHGR